MQNISDTLKTTIPGSFFSGEKLDLFYSSGYVVFYDILNETELEETRKRLDQIYEIQSQEAEHNHYRLEEINEENLVRMPFAYDPYFMKLLTLPDILGCVEKILGNYFIVHLQNGILNKPAMKHHQDHWHRDLPYQDFVISKPLAVNALFCIDEFSEKSGATFVIPSSHKMEKFPSPEFVDEKNIQVIAPAGSVILMDSMLYHRAGYNSSGFTRRAINQVYSVPILKQQISIPAALKGKYSEDPFLFRLLGYDSSEAGNVYEYRQRRLNKK